MLESSRQETKTVAIRAAAYTSEIQLLVRYSGEFGVGGCLYNVPSPGSITA